MKCEEIKNKLSLLIDNEINSDGRKIVEGHLSQCSVCQKELRRLESINSIAKAEIFDEPGSEYWRELTGNIMNEICPAQAKQPFWSGVLDKIENVFLQGRLNYRLVGLAAATVILIFFVKISFFNQGKFNLPMEISEIETQINNNEYNEADEALAEFKGRHATVEEEKIVSKPTPARLSNKKGVMKKLPKMVEGAQAGSGVREKNRQAILPKAGRGAEQLSRDVNLKKMSEEKEQETLNRKIEIVDERDLATKDLADEDINRHFEMAAKSEPVKTEHVKETVSDQVGGIKKRSQNTPIMDMKIPAPSTPPDSKMFSPKVRSKKKETFEYLPASTQADNSVSKGDPFIIVLQELNSKTKQQDKVKLLKAYLQRYPETIHKNQATYLLAENLIQFAKETKSEKNIEEAVTYFQENEIVLKKFDNYKILKKSVKELEKKN